MFHEKRFERQISLSRIFVFRSAHWYWCVLRPLDHPVADTGASWEILTHSLSPDVAVPEEARCPPVSEPQGWTRAMVLSSSLLTLSLPLPPRLVLEISTPNPDEEIGQTPRHEEEEEQRQCVRGGGEGGGSE